MTAFVKFGDGYVCTPYLKLGWSRPEPDFVWSEGREAVLKIPIGSRVGDWALELKFLPFLPTADSYQGFTVSLDGALIGRCIARKPHCAIELLVPGRLVSGKSQIQLEFHFHTAMRPCDVSDANDDRLLSIALSELTLTPLGGASGDIRELTNIQFSGEEADRFLRQERDADAEEVNRSLQTQGPNARSLTMMIESYVRGVGAVMHIRPRVRDAITARANREAPDAPPVFDWHRLRTEGVEYFTPSLAAMVLRRSEYDDVSRTVVFPSTANNLYDPNPKLPYFGHVKQENRQPFEIFCSEAASVHIHPYHCVIYSGIGDNIRTYFNPQGLGASILSDKKIGIKNNILVLQDQFDCGNLAHFLFDTITRVFYFCENYPKLTQNTVFIFGGWPGEFHQLILASTASILGLSRDQFIFPRSGYNIETEGCAYWFSDQIEFFHPAQAMQPKSVEFLQILGACLRMSSQDTGNIYISRSDASSRRLSNEIELLERLKYLDFKVLSLSRLPAQEQIDIVANATCVVAPHGMGLTHLAFTQKRPVVVELFNPGVGSETYALLCKAYGLPYEAIVGWETDSGNHDFSVEPDEVTAAVEALLAKVNPAP